MGLWVSREVINFRLIKKEILQSEIINRRQISGYLGLQWERREAGHNLMNCIIRKAEA